ncbi:hypothetical protein MHYP_G00304810 [Metynnis hypsauchen]
MHRRRGSVPAALSAPRQKEDLARAPPPLQRHSVCWRCLRSPSSPYPGPVGRWRQRAALKPTTPPALFSFLSTLVLGQECNLVKGDICTIRPVGVLLPSSLQADTTRETQGGTPKGIILQIAQ